MYFIAFQQGLSYAVTYNSSMNIVVFMSPPSGDIVFPLDVWLSFCHTRVRSIT